MCRAAVDSGAKVFDKTHKDGLFRTMEMRCEWPCCEMRAAAAGAGEILKVSTRTVARRKNSDFSYSCPATVMPDARCFEKSGKISSSDSSLASIRPRPSPKPCQIDQIYRRISFIFRRSIPTAAQTAQDVFEEAKGRLCRKCIDRGRPERIAKCRTSATVQH